MTARKLFIILITVAALLVLYVIYGFFNSAPILMVNSGSGSTPQANIPDSNAKMGKIGTTSVGPVVKSSYVDYDENQNVKREFGFDRLIHENGSEWSIEKPYMNIIEKDFVCGITADTGKVQVEMSAGKVAPRDAQLSGNVIIHILPDKGAQMSESFIYLDDISYISEKSLFTTAGPVHFVSADAEMTGTGLEVIYNTGKDRLELLQLAHLESLLLKTFKESLFAKRSGQTQAEQNNSKSSPALPAEPSGGQKTEGQYYRCILRKNVAINYGSRAIILAPDEFTISNLPYSLIKKDKSKKDNATAGAASSANKNETGQTKFAQEEIIPVAISCDDGIIVRPMEEAALTANKSEAPQRMVELTGIPVTIKASDVGGFDDEAKEASGSRILAECGWLKYNLDLGILDMFSKVGQQNVSLNLEQDGSKLETTDSLTWSIKERKAVVRGPGTLYFGDGKQSHGQQQTGDKSRMNFGGTMNVAFADEPLQKSLQQTMSIKSIDLAGGFTAAVQNDKAHLAADSANLSFAGDNALLQANLDGSVNFSSDSGSLKSQKAKVLFTVGNAVSQADFDGNVNFNSNSGSARSENAKVLFDKGNAISEADLNGGVNFDSATGSLKSQKAKVLFTKDSKGNVYASSVQSIGNVEIVPVTSKGQTATQGVFRAQRIDYDIPKGYAVADGPVELIFHNNKGAAGDANEQPATITAQQKAEYFLKSNEVVFAGDVAGKMVKAETNEYTEFHCDKLIAKLGRPNKDKAGSDAAQGSIEHLSITGDVVKFELYQKQQDNIVGGVKLKCHQADYDGIKNTVQTGGGKDCFVYIDNSKAPEVKKSGGAFNPKGPCLVYLQDFENLQWSMGDNRIVADGIPGGMHVTYLPTAQGKEDQKVQIDAAHVQIDLTQMPTGRKEIAALKATGGIYYRQESNYELYGREFFYDSGKSLISITGDSSTDCMANGVRCKGITINSNTGSAQMEGFTGGWLLIPPKKAK